MNGSCSSHRLVLAGVACPYIQLIQMCLAKDDYHMANPEEAERDPRVYFAAERTFLAWIRTGLGLMGVGFAVARFGLFLRQMQSEETHMPIHATGLSVWSGVALVALGVIVNLSAVFSHIAVVKRLRSGTWIPGQVSKSAVALAIVLAIVGIGMGLYLLFVR
jgi:putative membrane protein